MTSFPANYSYSFHIKLKWGGQLDHEVVQHMAFQAYNTPNFDFVTIFLKISRI